MKKAYATSLLLMSSILPQVGYSQGNNEASPQTPVDLVLKNATVYTVNDKQPFASSVAIKDGKIVFCRQ